ncbi:MAG: amino acid racemase [Defluviitaleaceae bacterium]|nr:amino acid racemase [Defluviitaleaceae bacterium]
MSRPLLGVLGGMGVQATGYFYDILNRMQNVSKEQDYLDVLVYSKPSIPDRTAFITGQSTESPLSSLLHGIRLLEAAGAGCIAIPCVTAHYFYKELAMAASVPVLNILEETALHAEKLGHTKVGLLATDGTMHSRIFHKAFAAKDIEIIEPSRDEQVAVMKIIYDTKCGTNVEPAALAYLAENLHNRGAQGVVLGCTELPLVFKGQKHEYIEAMAVLAAAALCRGGILPPV